MWNSYRRNIRGSADPVSDFSFHRGSSSVSGYLAETEAAMTKPETGEFLFDDLRELAASHTQQKLEFEKLIPDSICLGLLVVSCVLPLCYQHQVSYMIDHSGQKIKDRFDYILKNKRSLRFRTE